MKNHIDDRYFQELSEANPNDICRNAVCQYNKSTNSYSLIVWGDEFVINPAEKTIENVCCNFIVHDYFYLFIIYYLLKSKKTDMQNVWISEKDIPGGSSFFRGPHEIPTRLIAEKFNQNINDFRLICEQTGGIELKKADAAYYFQITPRIPVAVLFWDGDEDFPPEAKIMYDKSIIELLSLDIVYALAVAICDRIGNAELKNDIPVITDSEIIDRYVGQLITIEGLVNNLKTASIIGVDVESFDPDLRNQVASATGILHREVVTEEELQEKISRNGIFANRGPGTFYCLIHPESDFKAHVEALDTTKEQV